MKYLPAFIVPFESISDHPIGPGITPSIPILFWFISTVRIRSISCAKTRK